MAVPNGQYSTKVLWKLCVPSEFEEAEDIALGYPLWLADSAGGIALTLARGETLRRGYSCSTHL